MDVARARRLFDKQLRRGAGAAPTTSVERSGAVVRELSTEPGGWAAVVWSDLQASTADPVIDEQLAHFARAGRSFEWKLYDGDAPDDLPERLRARGFISEE